MKQSELEKMFLEELGREWLNEHGSILEYDGSLFRNKLLWLESKVTVEKHGPGQGCHGRDNLCM